MNIQQLKHLRCFFVLRGDLDAVILMDDAIHEAMFPEEKTNVTDIMERFMGSIHGLLSACCEDVEHD